MVLATKDNNFPHVRDVEVKSYDVFALVTTPLQQRASVVKKQELFVSSILLFVCDDRKDKQT
jgi:hypothetical protein